MLLWPGVAGRHGSVRTARRYRSVAISVRFSPSTSTRMPVRIGSVSSRLAAMLTWPTASVKTSPATVPDGSGIDGSVGYSSTGIVSSVKRPDPQVTATRLASVATSTGLPGSAREMSASRRPETRTVPASATSAGSSTRADTS
jgi:hypothetical protein